MDIDRRIESLTMNLELLASMHQDFEKMGCQLDSDQRS
jgi:hypothetical protein